MRVGFYDPFTVYTGAFKEQLESTHLTNLHWRAASNDLLKSIAELPVSFVEETPESFDNSISGPLVLDTDESIELQVLNLTSIPYVRLIFVTAEDTESYRSKVRPLIQEWKKSCVEKAHGPVDWYVVYVGDESKAASKLYDKLKTDFETETDKRCYRLKVNSNELELQTMISHKLKESILAIFTTRLQLLNAALQKIKSSDLKNEFKSFVVVKEAIASQFLAMNLYEEALEQYDLLMSSLDEYQEEVYGPQTWEFKYLNTVENYMKKDVLFEPNGADVSLFELKSFIFTRIFKAFEALADTSPSLSLASIHIAELLRRLQTFLADCAKDFENGENLFQVQEWEYKIIEEVMSLDMCSKLLLNDDPDTDTSPFTERSGETLLLQRSLLLKLGQAYDYYINGVLTDITLSGPHDSTTLSYLPLKPIFESKKEFQEQFVKFTEAAIKYFNMCDRPRSVDALSIDIALLDYQNEEYEKAAVVLSTCPEFYGGQGWKLISITLLEAYIGCLEKIDESCELFSVEGQPSREDQLLQSFINVLKLAKENKFAFAKGLISKAVNYIVSSTKHRPLDLNDFFPLEASSYVRPSKSDTYELSVTITNPYPVAIPLTSLQLDVENMEGDFVRFNRDRIVLETGVNNLKLSSSVIQSGTFTLSLFRANMGFCELSHIFQKIEKAEVYIIETTDMFSLAIENSSEVDLGSRPVSVILKTNETIDNIRLRVYRSSEAFEIHENCKIKRSSGSYIDEFEMEENCLVIPRLEGPEEYEIIIPYSTIISPKDTVIELYASASYEAQGEKRGFKTKDFIETALSIGVSVQDIFKINCLYCKFSIGTSIPEHPLRIISANLEPNERYSVSSPLSPGPLVAFGEQPVNYFCQIRENEDNTTESSRYLKLKVLYRELKSEAKQFWKYHLFKELRKCSLDQYLPLLLKCSETLDVDYNEFIYNKVLCTNTPNDYHQRYFKAIPPEDRLKVFEIFSTNLNSKIKVENDFHYKENQLVINVLIPVSEVVHNVEIKLHDDTNCVVIGQTLSASLRVTSVVKANDKKLESNGKKRVQFHGEQFTLNKFSVELANTQDNWLVNGKTRFVIELDKSSKGVYEFPEVNITLIPLKVGRLPLPRVKVEGINSSNKSEALMEVDYKNESETIYVISENDV